MKTNLFLVGVMLVVMVALSGCTSNSYESCKKDCIVVECTELVNKTLTEKGYSKTSKINEDELYPLVYECIDNPRVIEICNDKCAKVN